MHFTETDLAGAYLIELERHEDPRGYFARTYCRREFERHGLNPAVVQCNLSYNATRGTLRGMHYQAAPHAEAKLVRCVSGRIHDVIVDIRRGSPTFLSHYVVELSAEDGRSLYVPEGFAHGFQTLTDDTVVHYQMSEYYEPDAGRGIRWDDPALAIAWPIANPILSERDAALPSVAEFEAP